jgi:hypothetical protein
MPGARTSRPHPAGRVLFPIEETVSSTRSERTGRPRSQRIGNHAQGCARHSQPVVALFFRAIYGGHRRLNVAQFSDGFLNPDCQFFDGFDAPARLVAELFTQH